MPEKIINDYTEFRDMALLIAIGMVVGLGQLLASSETLTARIIVGRALSTAGIALAAGAVLMWFPDLGMVGKCGVAAGLSSLGTSGLEKIFQRFAGGSSQGV